MTEPSGPSTDQSPAGRLLDIALFAPLGLAMSIGEAIPELARKGRSRLEPQFGAARTVGQLAVGQGKRQLSEMLPLKGGVPFKDLSSLKDLPSLKEIVSFGAGFPLKGFPLGPFGPSSPAVRPSQGPTDEAGGVAPGPAWTAPGPVTLDGAANPVPQAPVTQAPVAATPARQAGHLAIPSYDALSAPQVVQRLAGLSRDEVRAVRTYEAATRGRRTILAKADQLLM